MKASVKASIARWDLACPGRRTSIRSDETSTAAPERTGTGHVHPDINIKNDLERRCTDLMSGWRPIDPSALFDSV